MFNVLRVAIIGAGPAGIYAVDGLLKAERDFEVSIDVFDQYPVPYGLIRYGVAPDHPRIKGIVIALHKILSQPEVRFFGNVVYGEHLTLPVLRRFYDVIIFATGAVEDAVWDVPGADLGGVFGAASFVSWYDGLPSAGLDWSLDSKVVAVVGNGNVALDVARVLVKRAEDFLSTEVADNVYQCLQSSAVTDVHVFGRRGPAQSKFTPLELRELGKLVDVDVVVYPEDFEFDAGSMELVHSHNQVKSVVNTLQFWTLQEPSGASRRLHLHFLQNPVAVLGEGGLVSGLRVERMQLVGDGSVRGTGDFFDYKLGAVYSAIGYFGSPLLGLAFDSERGVVCNLRGRVLDDVGVPVLGVYTTGWIKRGPVGLIGHTKGDALETVGCVLEDLGKLDWAVERDLGCVVDFLVGLGVEYTTWQGWLRLDAYERELGSVAGRDRVKVVSKEEMLRVCRGEGLTVVGEL